MPKKGDFHDRLARFIGHLRLKPTSFEKEMNFSNASISKNLKEKRGIESDRLETIVSKYPELNVDWLFTGRGSMLYSETFTDAKTSSNHDNGIKMDDIRETFYRDLIENNPEYSIMPKAILKDYKIVPDKLVDMITQGLDAKYELIIDGLKNKIARIEAEKAQLEKEKEDLQRQIPAKNK